MEPREEAECEVSRDLKKKTKQLLVDVYEELLQKNRDIQENIVHANKRMSSLTARLAIRMVVLSGILTVLTIVIAILTLLLWLR